MSEEFPPESGGNAEQDAMAAEWEAALAQQAATPQPDMDEFANAASEVTNAQPQMTPAAFANFAPAQASKRIEQWGAAGLQQRLAEAWVAFMQPVTRAEPPWLRVVEHHGLREAEAVYRTLLDGTAAPQDGHIVTLGA